MKDFYLCYNFIIVFVDKIFKFSCKICYFLVGCIKQLIKQLILKPTVDFKYPRPTPFVMFQNVYITKSNTINIASSSCLFISDYYSTIPHLANPSNGFLEGELTFHFHEEKKFICIYCHIMLTIS